MAEYTYSVADDTLNGTCNLTELHKEIDASTIKTNFEGVKCEGDVLKIYFSADLTSQSDLTTIVNAHTAVSTITERTCANCSNFAAIK